MIQLTLITGLNKILSSKEPLRKAPFHIILIHLQSNIKKTKHFPSFSSPLLFSPREI